MRKQVDETIKLHCNFEFCKKPNTGPKNLFSHLKEHIRKGDKATCPFSGCCKEFSVASTFTSHLSRSHKSWSPDAIDSKLRVSPQYGVDTDVTVHSKDMQNEFDIVPPSQYCDEDLDDNNDPWYSMRELQDTLKNKLALFCLNLQTKHHVPAKVIDHIVNEIQSVNEFSVQNIEKQCKDVFSKYETDEKILTDIMAEVISILRQDPISHSFHPAYGELRSIQTRKTFYKSKYDYVEPASYNFADDNSDSEGHFHYVPILESLKAMYKDPKIENALRSQVQTGNILCDFTDGTVFKTSQFFKDNPDALQLILYQDSFETANPLGSAKKKHKILAVYYTLGNLHSSVRSAIDTMQLVLLCKETDFKKQKDSGPVKLFQHLIKDLKKLENEGVYLGDKWGRKRGTVAFILGDNLGSHMIGGYVENFSTCSHWCRYCLFPKDDLNAGLVIPRSYAARTKENYEKALSEKGEESHYQGVKYNSVFNSLSYFHVTTPGLPPCLGHDLFEGIVKVDLHLFLEYFVHEKKWFTYEQLNVKTKTFKLKGSDALDKPATMNGNALQGHAVQVWTFLRFIPLYIGNKIEDQDDSVWKLLLLLRNCVEVICKPFVQIKDIILMNDYLEEYLYAQAQNFPSDPLKPKHHYLTHYPQLTMQCGPLIRLWTLRFESKHSYFKKSIRSAQNFKNITSSLAEKHQLLQALYSQGSLFKNSVSYESAIIFKPQLYNEGIQLAVQNTAELKIDHNTLVCSKVFLNCTCYKVGSYILLGKDQNDNIQCGEIMLILLVENKYATFVVNSRSTIYMTNLGLHKIDKQNPPVVVCVSPQNLLDIYPLEVYLVHGFQYLVLKHSA